MTDSSQLLVIAVGSPYVWDVVESARRRNFSVACVDNWGNADDRLPGLVTLDPVTHTAAYPQRDIPYTVGLSSAPQRRDAYVALAHEGFSAPFTLIDPTAIIASTVSFGHGNYVNAGVVVGSHTNIGCGSNINRSASIGHDNEIGLWVSISPGAVLAGGIRVGDGATIGSGATVLPGIQIGAGAFVGAGAVVTKDVPSGAVVVGNPAAVIRTQSDVTGGVTCPYC